MKLIWQNGNVIQFIGKSKIDPLKNVQKIIVKETNFWIIWLVLKSWSIDVCALNKQTRIHLIISLPEHKTTLKCKNISLKYDKCFQYVNIYIRWLVRISERRMISIGWLFEHGFSFWKFSLMGKDLFYFQIKVLFSPSKINKIIFKWKINPFPWAKNFIKLTPYLY